MNNGRFTISLHILTLLASATDEWLTSSYLSGSVNVNPVLIRKEIMALREAGLIACKEGKNGGCSLAKPANKIRLSEVYEAVKQTPILGQARNKPNPDCRIGQQINQHLDELFEDAEQAMIKRLNKTTVADFLKQFD